MRADECRGGEQQSESTLVSMPKRPGASTLESWLPRRKRPVMDVRCRTASAKTRAQHAGILGMFVANDSVRLARQTKGIESDEDVDQCRFLAEMKVWIRPGGLRFAG